MGLGSPVEMFIDYDLIRSHIHQLRVLFVFQNAILDVLHNLNDDLLALKFLLYNVTLKIGLVILNSRKVFQLFVSVCLLTQYPENIFHLDIDISGVVTLSRKLVSCRNLA